MESVKRVDPALGRPGAPPAGGPDVVPERTSSRAAPVSAARPGQLPPLRALRAGARGVQRAVRPLTRSLRRKLILTIVVCLLPLALLFAVSISQRYADRRSEELSVNREVAEALAVATEAYVRNLDHQLRAIGFALGRLDPDQQLAIV